MIARKGPRAGGDRHHGERYIPSSKSISLPRNWRERLPAATTYYPLHVLKLSQPNAAGWAQGVCPFHDDHAASLSVQMTGERGLFRCFAGCGHGDLVTFHMRRTGLDFPHAVRDLMVLRS